MAKKPDLGHIHPSLSRVLVVGPNPRYWSALGEFLEAFTTCEGVMFSVLTFYAGVAFPIAKVLFSGKGMKESMNYIIRISEVQNMAQDRRADLTKIFAQLSAIADVRNSILHYGTFVTRDKGRVTSTARRALLPEKIQERRASITILKAMTVDIRRISTAILWDMNPKRPTSSDPSLAAPWQYTPDPQASQAKASQRKTKGRPRKPRSA
jgi:hypothetical protein